MFKKSLMAAMAVSALLLGTAAVQAQTQSVNTVVSDTNRAGFFMGGNVGANLDTNGNVAAGVTTGYQFNRHFRGELSYDYFWRAWPSDGSALMANVIVQQEIPNTKFTPYLLVGAGMGFGGLGTPTGSDGLWAIGGGVRYAVSANLELDARYKHLGHFSTNGMVNADALTMGLAYHF